VSRGFDLDWLRLREVADRRARSRSLARRFAAAVRARARGDTAVLLDLGAGTGANFRALAPLIPGDQDWRLIDRDAVLLAHQPAEIAQWARAQGYRVAHGSGIAAISSGDAEWRAHSVALDIAALDRLPLAGVHGVTCSALLDLVSRHWLGGLVGRLGAARLPFLAALTTDGRREWQPAHEADWVIAAAFARHHHRDKGFGPALGGDAPAEASSLLRGLGYAVESEPSDWRLGAESEAALGLLIDGTATAATEADTGTAPAIVEWRKARHAERESGTLRLLIGHRDIFAEMT
jgi:hypothetical protein